jgi:hypothetical protein
MKPRTGVSPKRRRAPRRPRSVRLDERYLAAIDLVEALEENRTGADKTWVEHALDRWREHYARAVRIR